jgi:hypothetical protein
VWLAVGASVPGNGADPANRRAASTTPTQIQAVTALPPAAPAIDMTFGAGRQRTLAGIRCAYSRRWPRFHRH